MIEYSNSEPSEESDIEQEIEDSAISDKEVTE